MATFKMCLFMPKPGLQVDTLFTSDTAGKLFFCVYLGYRWLLIVQLFTASIYIYLLLFTKVLNLTFFFFFFFNHIILFVRQFFFLWIYFLFSNIHNTSKMPNCVHTFTLYWLPDISYFLISYFLFPFYSQMKTHDYYF